MKIFISSTYVDLKKIRKIAEDYFTAFTAVVEAMELWPAADEKPLKWCLDKIKQSDLVIGIYGARYGSIDEESGKSLTELEYIYARENDISVLPFIIGPDFIQQDEGFEDMHKQNMQSDFINRIQKDNILSASFNNEEEFIKKLDLSFRKHMLTYNIKDISVFDLDMVWSDLDKADSSRNADLKIDALLGNGLEETIKALEDNVHGMYAFIEHIQRSYEELGSDVEELFSYLGYEVPDSSNLYVSNLELYRKIYSRDWAMVTFFPNRIKQLEIILCQLKIIHLSKKKDDNPWSLELANEISDAHEEYKKLLEGAYYID